MTDPAESSYSSDICLLLRAHGEQLWLTRQVVPLLGELEQSDVIPEDQLGAALAYLEVLWVDACRRAAETEAALAALLESDAERLQLLHPEAREYHAAVRAMRDGLAGRVARFMAPPRADTRARPAVRARCLLRRSHTLRSPNAT